MPLYSNQSLEPMLGKGSLTSALGESLPDLDLLYNYQSDSCFDASFSLIIIGGATFAYTTYGSEPTPAELRTMATAGSSAAAAAAAASSAAGGQRFSLFQEREEEEELGEEYEEVKRIKKVGAGKCRRVAEWVSSCS